MQTEIYYEVSQGIGNKMYTLWRVVSSIGIYNRFFIQNLSIDKEQALLKAKEIAGDREILDDSHDSLRPIIRSDSGLIPFGKFYGKPITEVPDSYLLWLSQGGPIKGVEEDRDVEYSYTNYLASDFLKNLAIEEAKKKGLYVEYNGEWMPITLRDYLIEWNIGWGHHFEEKTKVKLELTLIKEAGFNSDYGWISILTFKDSENRKFQYKGSKVICTNNVILESGSIIYGKPLRKDDTITLSGTIKLADYKGKQITYLQRIKVL